MVVENGVIKDIAYTGSGCAISQASTAMMMELVKGRTLEEARHLVNLFLGMIRGDVTDDSQLEELEAACTCKMCRAGLAYPGYDSGQAGKG